MKTMNIFVGNLSTEVTEEKLRLEFMAFGEVISATIIGQRYAGSRQSMGHGFVEMLSCSEGEAAITALNGKVLGSRTINVIQALPLSHNGGNASFNDKKGGSPKGKVRQRRYGTDSYNLFQRGG